jgi:hypothetical protein
MSVASDGIWFPIANNRHPHNSINDPPADTIQPPSTYPGKSVGNRRPSIHPGYWNRRGRADCHCRQADVPTIDEELHKAY